MLDHGNQDEALDTPQTLRDDAEYASLARHAVTDEARALTAAVCQQVEDWESQQGTRKRKRLSKGPAFARAIEGFSLHQQNATTTDVALLSVQEPSSPPSAQRSYARRASSVPCNNHAAV